MTVITAVGIRDVLVLDVTLTYRHLRDLLARAERAREEDIAQALLAALGALRPVTEAA